jgi:outer membrane protein assembly factor BamB
VKKLEKGERKTAKIAVAILALLLLSSVLMLLNSAGNTVAAQDYGDLMQYDWRMYGRDSHNTRFNPGPAPNTPNVIWQTRSPTGGRIRDGPPTAFDGKVFVNDRTNIYAHDALTGALLYETPMYGRFRGFGTGGVWKIDDTYFGYEARDGIVIYRIATGEFVHKFEIEPEVDGITNPGGFPCMYWGGFYDYENKMKYSIARDYATNAPVCIGFDLSSPATGATLAWKWFAPTGLEHLGSGGGLAFFGGYGEGEIYALNATTGELVWKSWKVGNTGYDVTYHEGKLYHSASSTRITCYDATNGDIIFDVDTGDRSFFAFGGALAYGMFYDKSMLPGAAYIGAWDAETGEQRWKYPAHFTISYCTPVVADGKLYTRSCDQRLGSSVAGFPSPGYNFVCLDALTGQLVWELPFNINHPIIAYGNLYGIYDSTLYCIGDKTVNWPQWQNPDTRGVAVGQYAPADIVTESWAFKAGGPIVGSATAVDGKLYFGSYDGNYYCIDAKTAEEIWTFPTEYRIASTPAVVGGKMFTGADDGYVYAVDIDTGEQEWKTSAGGIAGGAHIDPAVQIRSSPRVVGSTVYVGAMDGKVYALNTANGQVRWTATVSDPSLGLAGSPTIADGALYITSCDGDLYALDAADGLQIWAADAAPRQRHLVSTPIVVDDMVIIGCTDGTFMGRMRVRAYNATDGSTVWTGDLDLARGSTPMMWTPSYMADMETVVANETDLHPIGTPYIMNETDEIDLDMLFLSEGMHVSAWAIIGEGTNLGSSSNPFIVNSTYGVRIWKQWVGHQIFASVVVADALASPRLYVGNDAYGLTCFNATDGATLSNFVAQAQVFSTATVYDGTVYVGSQDKHLYAFKNQPTAPIAIEGWTNKGASMYTGETLEIHGRLYATTTFTSIHGLGDPQVFHPPIPNAEVKVSFTNPDLTTVDYSATTDDEGYFMVSHVPNVAGDSGWVAWYDGEEKPWITYEATYSEWNPVSVVSPTEGPSNGNGNGNGTEPPPAAALPIEYIYGAVAVIIIVVVAFLAYFFLRKR